MLEHAYRRRTQQAALRLLTAASTAALEHLHELIDHERDALTAHRRRLPALPGT